MNRLFATLFVIGMVAAGCTTKAKARAHAGAAFTAWQQQQAAGNVRIPAFSVKIVGEVRYPVVEWSEGLTLAQAIVAAEYTGPATPFSIEISRNGEIISVKPQYLLQGRNDPALEPGDVVEIRR
jgi:hypothetical protein